MALAAARSGIFRAAALGSGLSFVCLFSPAFGAATSEEPWRDIAEQNRVLRELVQSQQRQIDELRVRVDQLAQVGGKREAEVAQLRERVESTPEPAREREPITEARADGKLVFSGEASVVMLAGQSDSWYPNREFRIDDAFLRVEAEAAKGVYFAAALELGKRSNRDETFHLGEAYVEFEDVSRAWGADRLVNLRIGRTAIPFGEEYAQRGVLTNPLVQNSLSDIWGIDEGIVVFGETGRASYAFAVQNGSAKYLADYNRDKAITLRIGYDLAPQLHVSASAMRTGDLNVVREPFSEIWFSGAVFRPIGSTATTIYSARLAELDARYVWSGGHLALSGGTARYNDNDSRADNSREFGFFQVEATHALDRSWWVAARYSALHVDRGYPMVGTGAFSKYFPGTLFTEDLWRLTLGVGYRVGPKALLKLDYTFEEGELAGGAPLRDRNTLAAQVGVGF